MGGKLASLGSNLQRVGKDDSKFEEIFSGLASWRHTRGSNDMAAIGAITKLKKLNFKVPDDVAAVGFDNIGIARWYNPPLTTVDQPRHQIGERAMQEFA